MFPDVTSFLKAQKLLTGASAEPIPQVLKTALDEQDSFFWSFHDCRSHHWRNGRVILLGDAAAGVGASMAMESAAALSDELSRTNAERVEQALDLYEKRHRRRVEEAQKNLRELLGLCLFNPSQSIGFGNSY